MGKKLKYPIVLIHGTGFRDRKHLNYWGRIPKVLSMNGAKIYYGGQDSWGTIEWNAEILKVNIVAILDKTGCDKVNLIAHSKGGLEARMLISSLKMSERIASLTTIATPHGGSKTIDLLLRLPKPLLKIAAFFTNLCFKIAGDKKPDFYGTIHEFGTVYMKKFNKDNPDAPHVYYQSYAAVMKNPFSDIFLFFTNLIINFIDGENDGLVTPDSATWTNFKGTLRSVGRCGISHADEVDLRRMRFSKHTEDGKVSDITDVYLKIYMDLAELGF
ncbi:hypothetical protein LQZ18_12470 [Lachnospiraceae bacterium ZAX-1]